MSLKHTSLEIQYDYNKEIILTNILTLQVFKAVINWLCLHVLGYEFTTISEEPTAPIFRVDN